MEIDWSLAKKHSLWSYEALLKKLHEGLAYSFVEQHYNHTMAEAQNYTKDIKRGYLQNQTDTTYIDSIRVSLNRLGQAQIATYKALVQQVDNREKCEAFLVGAGFGFEELIQVLNYLFRWVLPFANSLREFVDVGDQTHLTALKSLKQSKITTNLDMLEHCRTKSGRQIVQKDTGISAPLILTLVHRADISRLAYVRGKTVMHLCGGGYDTLERIAQADVERMEMDMDTYYRTIGKSLADFKSVIPLQWMVGGARILPKVIEV